MRLSRFLELLREELGRDLESPRPDQMTWRDYPGIHVVTSADPVGQRWRAKITVECDPSLSTHEKTFTSESDQMHWARTTADQIFNKLMNKPGYSTNRKL